MCSCQDESLGEAKKILVSCKLDNDQNPASFNKNGGKKI